jgi:fumarylpyruvate hydrolase
VFCVGQNYAAHTREMGGDPTREEPFFFAKPADALVPPGEIPYPPLTADLHHEVELVVALKAELRDATPDHARNAVFGYAVGLDLTRRDVQAIAKAKGRPWTLAKGFDAAAPISALAAAADVGHPRAGSIAFSVNGARRQTGDLNQMIWSVEELLVHLSRAITLFPGDLVFTGTPSGVGPMVPGDLGLGTIEGVGELRVAITRRGT